MQLERRRVSRKTPLDGRLEITTGVAAKCATLGERFDLELHDQRTGARIASMSCTCRGVENPHVHYFIECEALKALVAGNDVDLELDDAGKVVRVAPVRSDA